jgi:hypothetical protein
MPSIRQDFVPKLKDHVLPRIKQLLRREASASDEDLSPQKPGLSTLQCPNADRDAIFFKSDRMYSHHLARFNYTTYDVRRSQDVINPGTSHCNVMLLANNSDCDGDESVFHPFLYAHVLGIYHVNVIFTGEGSLDYAARRVEFLWVRWFEYDGNKSVDWTDLNLDSIRFPPMADSEAFGFVDPKNVLRGCHIIPAFSGGKARADGIGLSRLARDAQDWSRYRVNRCV